MLAAPATEARVCGRVFVQQMDGMAVESQGDARMSVVLLMFPRCHQIEVLMVKLWMWLEQLTTSMEASFHH